MDSIQSNQQSSTIWIIIYSKFSTASKALLDMIGTSSLDGQFQGICIDNKVIRTQIQKSNKFNIQNVPCILHIDTFTGIVQQFEGQKAFEIISSLQIQPESSYEPIEYEQQTPQQTPQQTHRSEQMRHTSLDELEGSSMGGSSMGGSSMGGSSMGGNDNLLNVTDISDQIPERSTIRPSAMKQKISASEIMKAQTGSIDGRMNIDEKRPDISIPVMEVKKTGKPINIAEVMSEAQRQSHL